MWMATSPATHRSASGPKYVGPCFTASNPSRRPVSRPTTEPIVTPAATQPATTTTAATTTTTVPATTTTAEATTTTEAPQPVYPLTGLPVTDAAVAARPALVVKIDNASAAQPQTGFNAADIVFEEIVNDNITRFGMVFHSQGSDPVGPCRSGRIQDIDLFGSLNRPLFAWSGGNATVTRAIDASDLVNIGPNHAPVYFRTGNRKAPHNLYTNTSDLWRFAPPGAGPPAQQFEYRGSGEAPTGVPSAGVHVEMDSYDADWSWNAATGLYERKQNGRVHNDAASGQITTNNVVVLVMVYNSGISGSPDAQSVGYGEAFVFTGGNYVHGTWVRPDRLLPFSLTDDAGNAIELTPGRTFIELPREGDTTPA